MHEVNCSARSLKSNNVTNICRWETFYRDLLSVFTSHLSEKTLRKQSRSKFDHTDILGSFCAELSRTLTFTSKVTPSPVTLTYLVEGETRTGAPGVAQCVWSQRGYTTVAWLSGVQLGWTSTETGDLLQCNGFKLLLLACWQTYEGKWLASRVSWLS